MGSGRNRCGSGKGGEFEGEARVFIRFHQFFNFSMIIRYEADEKMPEISVIVYGFIVNSFLLFMMRVNNLPRLVNSFDRSNDSAGQPAGSKLLGR